MASVLICSQAFGFSIEPMFLDMQPSGAGSRGVITVKNSSPRPFPVSVNISSITLDVNGRVKATPNTSDFIIFPSKAIIQPHSKQSFRVQWRGKPNLSIAKIYEVSVSQVLAKDNRRNNESKKTAIKLQIAMAFGVIINMRSATGTAKPIVRSSRLIRNKKGEVVLEAVISNNSSQNFLLVEADGTVRLFGASSELLWSKIYSPDEIKRKFGLGVVQPNKTRRIQFPLSEVPDHIARQARSVKFEIRPSEK